MPPLKSRKEDPYTIMESGIRNNGAWESRRFAARFTRISKEDQTNLEEYLVRCSPAKRRSLMRHLSPFEQARGAYELCLGLPRLPEAERAIISRLLQPLDEVPGSVIRELIPTLQRSDDPEGIVKHLLIFNEALEYHSSLGAIASALCNIAPEEREGLMSFIIASANGKPRLAIEEILRGKRDALPSSIGLQVEVSNVLSDPCRELELLQGFIHGCPENPAHAFPKLAYEGSSAQGEGVNRDYLTKLMSALCHPEQTRWRMLHEDGLCIPRIHFDEESKSDGQLDLDCQVTCCKGIGTVFARALAGIPPTKIGNHFHPAFYEMIHSLTAEEIDALNAEGSNAPRYLTDKLAKIYLRKWYPSIFNPNDLPLRVLDDEFRRLMKGEISPRLQDLCIDSSFLKEIQGPIRAALVVARSMQDNLPSVGWDAIRGRNAAHLQNRIEGVLSKDAALLAFGDHLNTPQGQFVRRYIEEADAEELSRFVFAVTGSGTLTPLQRLKIELTDFSLEHLPVMRTCFHTLQLPKYDDYASFKKKLEQSIENAYAGSGMQLT